MTTRKIKAGPLERSIPLEREAIDENANKYNIPQVDIIYHNGTKWS